jgi:hypothetical protein
MADKFVHCVTFEMSPQCAEARDPLYQLYLKMLEDKYVSELLKSLQHGPLDKIIIKVGVVRDEHI